jgi:hypothetical protein
MRNLEMLPVLAIPVIHSSGAWIASTAAGGYLAGTLSSTWLGAFVLGNSGLLASLGLVSAAGIAGSVSGGLAALGTSAALGVGSALTTIGLGGVAAKLGIAPVATFLGVTPAGWAIIGSVSTALAAIVAGRYWFKIREINSERAKGGLEPTTWREIIRSVIQLEIDSMRAILTKLSEESVNVTLTKDFKDVIINGVHYQVSRLKYVVEDDGTEALYWIPRIGKPKHVMTIVRARGDEPNLGGAPEIV